MYPTVKRLLDIILAIFFLIGASPLMLIVAIAIKIEDPKGPVIFKQIRVGKDKKPFKIYKFRSMWTETPDVPTHLLNDSNQFITRTGAFLRKTSIDELPQVWNILKGNMSFVGPRPSLFSQEDLIEKRDKLNVHSVRPGLTGLAQVNGRDELSIQVKAAYDGEYIKKMSLKQDIKLLLRTFISVAKSEGIVEGGTGKMHESPSNICENNHPRILLVANVAKEHVLKFHVPTIKMFKGNGWYVDVACSGQENVPYCDNQYYMSYKRSPFTLATFKGITELKKIIDTVGYDIIYCHTPVGGLVARLASINARKKGTRVIYLAHGYHFYKNAPKRNWALFYPIEKIMSKMTDSIILCNDEDYLFTKKHFQNCNAYQIDGIGVNLSRFKVKDPESIRVEYREQMNIPQDATVLIYLAELLHNKNQTFLMDVLKRILQKNDNVYLVLAGFDHSKGKFAKYAKKIGVSDHIRFLGWREDVGNLYAASDICTPTSIREGFGINLVEAMACGIPIVATRNRGHETIIRNGVNGFLVELGDTDSFVEKVIQLINDNELRQNFIDVGIADKEKFSSEAALKNIKRIFDENLHEAL